MGKNGRTNPFLLTIRCWEQNESELNLSSCTVVSRTSTILKEFDLSHQIFVMKILLRASVMLLFVLLTSISVHAQDVYNFAIMPKSIGNSFFFPVRQGCERRSELYSNNPKLNVQVSCEWVGPEDEDPTGEAQVASLRAIIAAHIDGSHPTHGIAISVMNAPSMVEPIQEALDAGMSVICFDSDSFESARQAYVGTDNEAFGVQLAKVLQQLRPTGGKLAMLTIPGPNLEMRVAGLRKQLADSGAWSELPDSLTYQEGTLDDAMEQIAALKRDNPDLAAIVPTYGGPMNEAAMWTSFVEEHRDMTFVVADAMPHQVELMEQGFADGLVGQLPYQSGEQSIDTLLSLQQSGNPPRDHDNDMVLGTNLSFLLRIPLVLPDLTVDMNYLGGLKILGYVLLAITAIGDLAMVFWVVRNRKSRIVAAGQPLFLLTILAGVLFLAFAIIPMGFDDETSSDQNALDAACMATPWLITIGFGVIFSALFSKLWRVDRLLSSSMKFSKVKVRAQDVLWPFLAVTMINVALLTSWTIVAPLVYTRKYHDGTDPWNRHISSYGSCSSSEDTNSLPFVVTLIIINLCALFVANYQAFRTRRVKSMLSESKYIAITVASITQAALVGLPVLLLVEDEPRAHYVVQVILIFCVCMAIMGFIFLPKVLALDNVVETMDARSSNFGASLGITSRSRSFKRSMTSSSGVANDTVAQIRAAAAATTNDMSLASAHLDEFGHACSVIEDDSEAALTGQPCENVLEAHDETSCVLPTSGPSEMDHLEDGKME
jgi:ABC-type sugar transport system substrate-binding protein